MDNCEEIVETEEEIVESGQDDIEDGWLSFYLEGRNAVREGKLSEAHAHFINGMKLGRENPLCSFGSCIMFLELAEVYFQLQQPVACKRALDESARLLGPEFVRKDALLRYVRLYSALGCTGGKMILKWGIAAAKRRAELPHDLLLVLDETVCKQNNWRDSCPTCNTCRTVEDCHHKDKADSYGKSGAESPLAMVQEINGTVVCCYSPFAQDHRPTAGAATSF
jgi:hypothetical protein